jgi:type IV secretion system protein VirB9
VRKLVLAVALVCFGETLRAAVVPTPGRLDPRVREVEYRAEQVVSLRGYVGYHVHIELAPGERFVALGAGDTAAVDVAAEGPHVLLKPKAEQVATNLTLVSSRRVYHFDYRAGSGRPDHEAVFVLRFRYPAPVVEVAPVATTATVKPVPPPRPMNRAYWFCGDASLRPVAAWDDGVQTRIRFGSRGEWPAIFVRNEDGSESLTNFHAEGTTAVVHRVAREFVLRRGGLVGCVENRAYGGSGEWVEAGTRLPGATREVRR